MFLEYYDLTFKRHLSVYDRVFVVFASIEVVLDDDKWWYPPCKCHKAATIVEGLYVCKSCELHMLEITLRRFAVHPSTNNTSSKQGGHGLTSLPIPFILPLAPSPKVT